MSVIVKISIICIVIVAILFFGGRYINDMVKYKKIISEIEIKTPDISNIHDGSYNGSFDAVVISADVSVTVKDNRITGIKIIEHKNDRGSAAESITDEVIINQSLEVDTVSGATNSSKVILKAIENALENQEG